jgi:hypothetical protein
MVKSLMHFCFVLLAGTLPAEYASLSKLQSLWLFSNKLKGQLPAAYGSMAELRDLQVSYNKFTGETWFSCANIAGMYVTEYFAAMLLQVLVCCIIWLLNTAKRRVPCKQDHM